MMKEEMFQYGDNNRQKCSLCGKRIPRYIKRISIYYRSRYGWNYKRICAKCICELSDMVDRETVESWKEKILAEEL